MYVLREFHNTKLQGYTQNSLLLVNVEINVHYFQFEGVVGFFWGGLGFGDLGFFLFV